jgi:signal transduction histidine kinase
MQVVFEDVTAETRRHDLLEAFAGQVVLGQEEERRHLAQELHDGPLQTLIHLCRQIDAVADPGPGTDDGSHASADDAPDDSSDDSSEGGSGDTRGDRTDDTRAAALASMRTTVEETVAELRSIARGLRPSVLDDLGLVASLNQVVQDATARQGFASAFDVEGPTRRLSPAVELAVFRIGQEAVTNVERHAAARHLSVRLTFDDGGLALTVEDDGDGFDTAAAPPDETSSLGLPGMAERARLVGGRLLVRSTVGQGTVVTARVPNERINPS